MAKNKIIFNSFQQYWKITRNLNIQQRDVVFYNLSKIQQKKIKESFRDGGWEDLLFRDQMDKILDSIRQIYGINVLQIRTKAVLGKSVYINRSMWEMVLLQFKDYDKKHTNYVIGGIQAISDENNSETVLIVKK